jgi:hypothetical protein
MKPLRSGEDDQKDDDTEHGLASCGSNAMPAGVFPQECMTLPCGEHPARESRYVLKRNKRNKRNNRSQSRTPETGIQVPLTGRCYPVFCTECAG